MSSPRTVTLCGRSLPEPGHICAFFDSRAEDDDILSPYFRERIAIDEEVINIVDADRAPSREVASRERAKSPEINRLPDGLNAPV